MEAGSEKGEKGATNYVVSFLSALFGVTGYPCSHPPIWKVPRRKLAHTFFQLSDGEVMDITDIDAGLVPVGVDFYRRLIREDSPGL